MFNRIKKGKASTSGSTPRDSNSNGGNNLASSGNATPLDGAITMSEMNSGSQLTDSAYHFRCKEILEMYRYLRELG